MYTCTHLYIMLLYKSRVIQCTQFNFFFNSQYIMVIFSGQYMFVIHFLILLILFHYFGEIYYSSTTTLLQGDSLFLGFCYYKWDAETLELDKPTFVAQICHVVGILSWTIGLNYSETPFCFFWYKMKFRIASQGCCQDKMELCD